MAIPIGREVREWRRIGGDDPPNAVRARGAPIKGGRTIRSKRMSLKELASGIFFSLFGQPLLVAAAPLSGAGAFLLTTGQDTTLLVREIDSLIGELLLGKRKKDVEDEDELDDEEEDEEDDDLEDDDEDDFDDDEDDEEFEEEFDDDDLDDDDDDIFYDDDDDE
jgi:hypothetical protein